MAWLSSSANMSGGNPNGSTSGGTGYRIFGGRYFGGSGSGGANGGSGFPVSECSGGHGCRLGSDYHLLEMDENDNSFPWGLIHHNELASMLDSGLVKTMVIDSRSFLEFNTGNIQQSVNMCCSKLVKRRLQQDKVQVLDLLSQTCHIGADASWDVIVYDQCTEDPSLLTADNFVHVLLRKLSTAFNSVAFLKGGFLAFQASHSSLVENKSSSYRCSTLTSLSQPCMPVSNVGPTRILPFLYLGSQQDAMAPDIAQVNGISYVLNVSKNCPRPAFIQEGHFHRIPVHDSYCAKLLPFFQEAFQFLDKVREANGCVLVHCLGGVSRSATLTIAYIMKHMRMTSDEAYRYVKDKRPTISPNFNFLGQLLEYEKIVRKQEADQEARKEALRAMRGAGDEDFLLAHPDGANPSVMDLHTTSPSSPGPRTARKSFCVDALPPFSALAAKPSHQCPFPSPPGPQEQGSDAGSPFPGPCPDSEAQPVSYTGTDSRDLEAQLVSYTGADSRMCEAQPVSYTGTEQIILDAQPRALSKKKADASNRLLPWQLNPSFPGPSYQNPTYDLPPRKDMQLPRLSPTHDGKTPMAPPLCDRPLLLQSPTCPITGFPSPAGSQADFPRSTCPVSGFPMGECQSLPIMPLEDQGQVGPDKIQGDLDLGSSSLPSSESLPEPDQPKPSHGFSLSSMFSSLRWKSRPPSLSLGSPGNPAKERARFQLPYAKRHATDTATVAQLTPVKEAMEGCDAPPPCAKAESPSDPGSLGAQTAASPSPTPNPCQSQSVKHLPRTRSLKLNPKKFFLSLSSPTSEFSTSLPTSLASPGDTNKRKNSFHSSFDSPDKLAKTECSAPSPSPPKSLSLSPGQGARPRQRLGPKKPNFLTLASPTAAMARLNFASPSDPNTDFSNTAAAAVVNTSGGVSPSSSVSDSCNSRTKVPESESTSPFPSGQTEGRVPSMVELPVGSDKAKDRDSGHTVPPATAGHQKQQQQTHASSSSMTESSSSSSSLFLHSSSSMSASSPCSSSTSELTYSFSPLPPASVSSTSESMGLQGFSRFPTTSLDKLNFTPCSVRDIVQDLKNMDELEASNVLLDSPMSISSGSSVPSLASSSLSPVESGLANPFCQVSQRATMPPSDSPSPSLSHPDPVCMEEGEEAGKCDQAEGGPLSPCSSLPQATISPLTPTLTSPSYSCSSLSPMSCSPTRWPACMALPSPPLSTLSSPLSNVSSPLVSPSCTSPVVTSPVSTASANFGSTSSPSPSSPSVLPSPVSTKSVLRRDKRGKRPMARPNSIAFSSYPTCDLVGQISEEESPQSRLSSSSQPSSQDDAGEAYMSVSNKHTRHHPHHWPLGRTLWGGYSEREVHRQITAAMESAMLRTHALVPSPHAMAPSFSRKTRSLDDILDNSKEDQLRAHLGNISDGSSQFIHSRYSTDKTVLFEPYPCGLHSNAEPYQSTSSLSSNGSHGSLHNSLEIIQLPR